MAQERVTLDASVLQNWAAKGMGIAKISYQGERGYLREDRRLSFVNSENANYSLLFGAETTEVCVRGVVTSIIIGYTELPCMTPSVELHQGIKL